jgi:hypothetical protein
MRDCNTRLAFEKRPRWTSHEISHARYSTDYRDRRHFMFPTSSPGSVLQAFVGTSLLRSAASRKPNSIETRKGCVTGDDMVGQIEIQDEMSTVRPRSSERALSTTACA